MGYRCTGPNILEKKKGLCFKSHHERLVRPQGHPQRQEVNDQEDARGDGEAPQSVAGRGAQLRMVVDIQRNYAGVDEPRTPHGAEQGFLQDQKERPLGMQSW